MSDELNLPELRRLEAAYEAAVRYVREEEQAANDFERTPSYGEHLREAHYAREREREASQRFLAALRSTAPALLTAAEERDGLLALRDTDRQARDAAIAECELLREKVRCLENSERLRIVNLEGLLREAALYVIHAEPDESEKAALDLHGRIESAIGRGSGMDTGESANN